ncbi:YciI family protein [Actinophytocola sp. NPDC049390]|uniref:YciI family protein n=1 Tax=Actinophytocola sp. NPDC049390 TaxID=3363894 RepID=UPI0037A95D19
MALFLLTYGYNETDLRAQRRDDHVAYLNELHADGALVAAGPYEDGSGGAILLNAEDVAAAEKLVADDPYTRLDVTRNRYLRPWKVVVGGI